MGKETENTSGYNICEMAEDGQIRIADEVVAVIAGIAATETEGVASTLGNFSRELVSKLGRKDLSKGIKVEISKEGVLVDIIANMKYGYNIPKVCKQVQEKVATAIASMTGMKVLEVNIRIAGVQIENNK